MVILNNKHRAEKFTIKIDNQEISNVASAKLLGLVFNDKQDWNTHINGTGGLIAPLNKRLYLVRRLRNHI